MNSYIGISSTDTARNCEIESGIANGTIAVGDIVALDTSVSGAAQGYTVIKAALSSTGNAAAVGVALDAATAGKAIRYATRGYVLANVVASTSVSGKALVVAGTAGQLAVYASGTHTASGPYAIGLDDSGSSGLTAVYARF